MYKRQVEPFLPKALLVLVGHGPVIETLATLGETAGFAVSILPGDTVAGALRGLSLDPSASVVVATHGELDEEVLTRTLATPAGYLSLVASRKRAGAIVETLRHRGVPPEQLDRLKAPAGLDIGAVTPEEIAVSILAEIIQSRHHRRAEPAKPVGLEAAIAEALALAEAKDPICGMTVEVATARHQSDWAGRSVYFCCARCKDIFDADPARYAAALSG